MKVSRSTIEDFYHAITSIGFPGNLARKSYNCLVRIGYASGFTSDFEQEIAERGIKIVALENTDNAATAIAKYILLAQGLSSIPSARCLIRMTTPSAGVALDGLIKKAWDKVSRESFLEFRQEYDTLSNRRHQSINYIFIDARNKAKASGFRIGRTIESALGYGNQIWFDGWIKSNGTCTLGIDLELESNTGELVLNSIQEAYRYAKLRGWIVVNARELGENP